jgi:hypothetical protein
LQWKTTQIDLGLTSAHFGKTKAGADFKEFLGDDEYENHIVAPFDNFLHESFSMPRNLYEYARMTNLLTGPEVCKSRACGMLGSKEILPGADEDSDRDSEDSDSNKCPVSHVLSSYQLERQKNFENNKCLLQLVDDHFKKTQTQVFIWNLRPNYHNYKCINCTKPLSWVSSHIEPLGYISVSIHSN